MTPLFKKLNFKNQTTIHLIQAPKSFEEEKKAMEEFVKFSTKVSVKAELEFVIIFSTSKQELNKLLEPILPKVTNTTVFWICYPKMSSKKYTSDLNRDVEWTAVGKANMEPVRAVAIDEDWSALRFKKWKLLK
jgi:hypothetical protein